MINNKFIRLGVPFALFAGVSWLLWRYSGDFLRIFPAYGLIFVWLSPPRADRAHPAAGFQEKELKFLFIFLVSAIGFILPGVVSQNRSVAMSALSFAEVAALWALFYALNSSQARLQEQAQAVSSEQSDLAVKIKNLQGEIKMYSEHRGRLLDRIKFQADLAASIQALAACVNADEIKAKLEEMLRKSFPDAVSAVESGAAKDSLAGWVAERKIPLFIKNASAENRFYPEDLPDQWEMAGFQLMVSNEVFRGRYRTSFEKPEPIRPDAVLEYTFSLHTQNYTFRKGHRVMVQVQSTWFPIIDRNPQTFVPNIFEATAGDFRAATHRVYRTPRYPSRVTVPVVTAAR